MFRIYAKTPANILFVGHQGENIARCVCFDLTDMRNEFGIGTWMVVFKRPNDTLPYQVQNTAEVDQYAVWGLDNTDTAKYGEGRCELRYYVDEVLCKTDVYAVRILPSLGATGDIPDPYEDLIEQINEAIEAGEIATEAASTATAAAESASGDASTASTAAESAAQSATDAAASAARLDDLYTMHTVTLSVASWSNNVQSATVTGVLADESKQLITVVPASASEDAYIAAGILATVQAADTITFRATVAPTEAITVYIVVANEVSGE